MLRILLASTTAAALLAGGALAQSDTGTKPMERPAAEKAETITPTGDASGGEVRVDTVTATDSDDPARKDDPGAAGDTAATEEMDKRAAGTTGTTATDTTTSTTTTEVTTTNATEGATSGGAASLVTTREGNAAPASGFLAAQSGTDMLATNLIGQSVVNPQDEKVGNVDDLVMDQSGRVTAAVIGVGGFLGIGKKNVGVPIEALEPRQTENGELQLVTMLTKEDLEAAPEFADLSDQRAAEAADRAGAAQEQTQPVGTGTTR